MATSGVPGIRVLWCLRRRRTDVVCVMDGSAVPVKVEVLHDRDVVVTELFDAERVALDWARAYGQRLRERGWADSPNQAPAA